MVVVLVTLMSSGLGASMFNHHHEVEDYVLSRIDSSEVRAKASINHLKHITLHPFRYLDDKGLTLLCFGGFSMHDTFRS